MTLADMVDRPAYRLYQLAWAGLDWLYPPECGGCGSSGSRWCPVCQNNIQPVPNPCSRCGQSLKPGEECQYCRASLPPFTALRACVVYNNTIRNAIHRLKFAGDVALGESLSRILITCLRQLDWDIDIITPVPAGVARRAERGYNQAALLALPVALSYGIPYRPRALTKVRETRSQIGLSVQQRRENVASAYRERREIVLSKRVLVIDDVSTSGATMEVCAQALLEAGAHQVFGLTLARPLQELS